METESRSTLFRQWLVACWEPSHYLTQLECWLIVNRALWHSHECNFALSVQDINLSKMSLKITLFTRGQFWGYCRCLRLCVCVSVCVRVCVYQSQACPHDNSPLVQARTTKFGTKVQKTMVKVPVVFWDDRSWLSRSNSTWKSNFTSFWACPLHNSSAVQARSTKFGPKCLPLLRFILILDLIGLIFTFIFNLETDFSTKFICAPFVLYLVRPVACKYQWDHRWRPIESVWAFDWT